MEDRVNDIVEPNVVYPFLWRPIPDSEPGFQVKLRICVLITLSALLLRPFRTLDFLEFPILGE